MVVTKTLKRFAFTMVELIFAIVIISIAVMSIPVMTQITSKGIESNILQEAIFAGSAELMGATSYYWDLNSMYDSNLSHLEKVIDIGGTCENNASNIARYRLRPGHVNQPFHRRCLESNAIAAADTADLVFFPNLNNAVHASQVVFTDNTADSAGYKDSYNSAVGIDYLNNNVKRVTVTITNSSADPITVLRTYSANIGEIDYYKRRF